MPKIVTVLIYIKVRTDTIKCLINPLVSSDECTLLGTRDRCNTSIARRCQAWVRGVARTSLLIVSIFSDLRNVFHRCQCWSLLHFASCFPFSCSSLAMFSHSQTPVSIAMRVSVVRHVVIALLTCLSRELRAMRATSVDTWSHC